MQPQNVRSAHQSMYHLVANADWINQALLVVVRHVLPTLLKPQLPCHWIVDDAGLAKKGIHFYP